jgi:TolA-binding protein
MRPDHVLPLALLCGALLPGCWTSAAEGEQLRTAAQARDARLEQLEEQNRTNRQELSEKVQELQEVIDKATQLLTRDSADVGVQVEEMRQQLASLEGQMAELKHKTDVLSHEMATQRAETDQKLASLRSGAGGGLDPSQVPADKDAHYQTAYQAYEQSEHEKARALFREFLTRYPEDSKAGNAQYWIGASYLQQNKPATALGEYRKVISEHGSSTAVNVALYGMADAFYRLHACTDAKSALQALLKRKPSSALKTRSRQLQDRIKNAKKGYCTS